MALDWIESNGGPLVLLPLSALGEWRGTEEPSSDGSSPTQLRVDPSTDGSSDYERACDATAQAPVAVLPVGPARALVLGGGPLPTAVLASDEGGVVFARWDYGSNDTAVEAALRNADLATLCWEPGGTWTARSGAALLFDAAYPGAEVLTGAPAAARLALELSGGNYMIALARVEPDAETAVRLVALYSSRSAT